MPGYGKYRLVLNATSLVLLLLMAIHPVNGQNDSLQTPEILTERSNDSLRLDTVNLDQDPWQPNPKKALWYSLALPGLGQIYNRSWWKTPFIYGGLGVSIWFIADNHQNYKDFRTAYSESFDPNTENELVKKYPNQESLRRIRDVYYKRYQLSIIATAAIYLMNGIEAYVDAHLKNFEISDDLSLRYGKSPLDRAGIYGSSTLTPNVIPVIGFSYRLD
ncbi:hypothetical protein KUV50_18050 [Membranicola marinus]|uniref:DUF5683 domain-containing protein n=1 Tax=Membranihabitans marinus TaxID=1227546 RepID=A0A953LAK6_9BACT|nr:DUF5683 domain-containing protein [Membranihabitans marinus]MBY5960060.1 hypothetical protein [Membranihabitans marinus]